MASGPITSWQKDGEKWKEWHLFSWAPKSLWTLTTAMKLKMLALQKKNYGKPWQHIKKKRRYFTKKVCIVKAIKAMVFLVFMYGCEICTIMNAEYWRIDAFELWCWRLLIVPWTAKRLNQSILKEIKPEYSLEGLMLKQKVQYFGQQKWRVDSLEKTLMLGKIEDGRRRGQQKMRSSNGITDSMNMSLSKLWVILKDRGVWCAAVHGVRKNQTWFSDWTATMTHQSHSWPYTLKKHNSKRHMYPSVHCSTIYSSQDEETI